MSQCVLFSGQPFYFMICIHYIFRSAILNAGYRVSLSHAAKNSIKTDAPHSLIWVCLLGLISKYLTFTVKYKQINSVIVDKLADQVNMKEI
jgi:hypothetical protein